MQSLATKYRPKTFDEVVDQGYVKDILKRQLETNNIRHCYLFAGKSGCVDKDTEYFNGTEWKKISEYSKGEDVLVFDPKDRSARLEKPSDYVKLPCGWFYKFHTKYGIDGLFSADHTMVYETSRGHIRTNSCENVVKAQTENKEGFHVKFLTTFSYGGKGIDLTDDEIRLMCAVICDGSFRTDCSTNWCTVNLKKERKIDLLRSILFATGRKFTETHQHNGYTRFYFYAPRKEKEFTSYWYDCNQSQLQVICDNILNWDGSVSNGRMRFSQKNKKTIDFVQFAFSACGYRTTILKDERFKRTKVVNGKAYTYENSYCYNLSITKRNKITLGKSKIDQVPSEDGYKYCFTVSTHMWIMRRNGRILITSNCGKTSLSRIFANEINKGQGSPIEIDAASHNGVDDIRAIVEDASLRSIDSEYKTFIIDEAHTITQQGWQAFLKTLEEPPAKTIFIFCTTNPEKIPPTIQNRVMRFNLTKIATMKIKERLQYICSQEGIIDKEDCCDYIAKLANGGMRDAIAYLEKVSDFSKELTLEHTLDILGSYSYDDFLSLTNALIDGNEGEILKVLDNVENQGKDLKSFVNEYLKFIMDLTRYSLFKDISSTSLPSLLEDKVKYAVGFEGNVKAFNIIVDGLLTLKSLIRADDNSSLTIRAYFVRIMTSVGDLWKN